MDLTSSKNIKELFLEHGTRPSKALGQNFLTDKRTLEKILKTADIKPDNVVLEVGPGIGTLTCELAKKAKKVIAVEKSKIMCEILTETLKLRNLEIINADILHYKLQTTNYKLVANIPYYLTSPLIRKFLECNNPPAEMILMVQKEVAQRICAKPQGMNLLAVCVQFYAKPEIISYISKNCFWPSPKVDSAIIKITPRCPTSPKLGLCRTSPDSFFRVVKAGFSHPRKQLLNNLLALNQIEGSKNLELNRQKTEEWLLKNNIKPTQRAETLSIDDWINLVCSL